MHLVLSVLYIAIPENMALITIRTIEIHGNPLACVMFMCSLAAVSSDLRSLLVLSAALVLKSSRLACHSRRDQTKTVQLVTVNSIFLRRAGVVAAIPVTAFQLCTSFQVEKASPFQACRSTMRLFVRGCIQTIQMSWKYRKWTWRQSREWRLLVCILRRWRSSIFGVWHLN